MSDQANDWTLLNRRRFTGMVLAVLGFGVRPVLAQDAEPVPDWRAHLEAILDGKKPTEDKVTLDLPEVLENGNLVPFTVAVDYPMSDTDFIQAVHVIATDNDSPPVASFYFTPLSAMARASSRMRLRRTQEIVALAQTSGGRFYIGRRRVEVVVGCCGESGL